MFGIPYTKSFKLFIWIIYIGLLVLLIISGVNGKQVKFLHGCAAVTGDKFSGLKSKPLLRISGKAEKEDDPEVRIQPCDAHWL